MKKLMFLLIGMFLSISLFSQHEKISTLKDPLYENIKPSTFFQQKKTKYDYKNYIWQPGDRYNPTVAGVCSFFIPGLGQIATGEPGRGIVFFLGFTTSTAVFYSSLIKIAESEYEFGKSDGESSSGHKATALFSGMITTAIWIGSIIDATNCAKINNLYFRDKHKVSIEPNINFLSSDISYGLSLKFNF